jgi:hypothetical protein
MAMKLVVDGDEHEAISYRVSRAASVRSLSYAQASKPVYDRSLEIWRNYEEFLTPFTQPLLPYLQEA